MCSLKITSKIIHLGNSCLFEEFICSIALHCIWSHLPYFMILRNYLEFLWHWFQVSRDFVCYNTTVANFLWCHNLMSTMALLKLHLFISQSKVCNFCFGSHHFTCVTDILTWGASYSRSFIFPLQTYFAHSTSPQCSNCQQTNHSAKQYKALLRCRNWSQEHKNQEDCLV